MSTKSILKLQGRKSDKNSGREPPRKRLQTHPASNGFYTGNVRFGPHLTTIKGHKFKNIAANVPPGTTVDQLLNEFHEEISSRIGRRNNGGSVYEFGNEGEFSATEVLPEGPFPRLFHRVPEHHTGREYSITRAFELYILATTDPSQVIENERYGFVRTQIKAINTLRHAYPDFYNSLELYIMGYVDFSINNYGLTEGVIQYLNQKKQSAQMTIATLNETMQEFVLSFLRFDQSRIEQGNPPSYFAFFQAIRIRNSQLQGSQSGGSLLKKKKTHKLKNHKRSRSNINKKSRK